MSGWLRLALFPVALALAGCATSGSTAALPTSSTAPNLPTFSTATTVNASPATAGLGQAVTVTATVTGFGNGAEGSVSFYDGSALLGTAALNASGSGSLSVTTLATGKHSLSAAYPGFQPSSSADGASPSSSSSPALVTVQGAPASVPVTAHSRIALENPAQQIAGFGGAEVYYRDDVFNNPYSQEIFTALYDPQQGLGLTFLRIENAVRWYTGLPLDPRMPEFIQAATATAGKAPILVMTEGSPPANLKGNGTLNGTFANDPLNTLVKVNGQYDYADFAQYWMDSLKAYAAIGVVPDMISIQNEPDFYGSVQFNPSEAPYRGTTFAGYAEAFDAVYRKLQTMATPPKMIGPELWSPNQGAPLAYAQALNAKEVYAFAHHLYDVDPNDTDPDHDLTDLSAYAQAMNATLPVVPRFQDEYFENNGFDTAWAIHNDLVEGGDNAYFYWALTWPNTPTDQEGLIYVDSAANPRSTWQYPHGWAAQDNYYAFKHFSLFVRPGYTLYPVTVDNPDERVSSYASADGKTVVVVLLNTSASSTDTVALDLSKLNVTGSTVYRSTFSVALTVAGAERWNNLGALPTGNTVTLAPNAVATVVLTIG